jgi:hypothetical protein
MLRMSSYAVLGLLVAATVLGGASSASAAVLVNINAQVNCYTPGLGVQVNLAAGVYKATLIQGPYMSWRWTSVAAGGTWNTAYWVVVSDNATAHAGGAWVQATTVADGFNNTANKELIFAQPVDGIANFYIADNHCNDNSGGLSLEIVAEPVPIAESTWGMVKALY